MNYNNEIRGDDSDVDIETITDTDWSVEAPGHSIQMISSASAPISTKPLEIFQNIVEDPIRTPTTRSYRIKMILSRKSGKISVSQASSLKSQTEHSASRCFVVQGQEPKLLRDKKLTKVQSQPVRCHMFASTSTTTTVRSTELARFTYIRNPAVCAIDKDGSHQHYLHRQIKQLISLMHTCVLNVDREIRLYHFALDSCVPDFYGEFTLLKSTVGSNEYEIHVKLLTSQMISFDRGLRRSCRVINCLLNSYANDLEKQITLLNSKIASYIHDLELQITLMNSKINSYVADLQGKLGILNSRKTPLLEQLMKEYDLLMSERVA